MSMARPKRKKETEQNRTQNIQKIVLFEKKKKKKKKNPIIITLVLYWKPQGGEPQSDILKCLWSIYSTYMESLE